MKLKILLALSVMALLTGCTQKNVYTEPAAFMKYDATNVKLEELSVTKACRNADDNNQVFEIGQAAQKAGISKVYYVDVEYTSNTQKAHEKCYTIYGK